MLQDNEIQTVLQISDNKKYSWAFKSFGITDGDIALGLRYIKSRVRSEFKQLARRYHPDTCKACKKPRKYKTPTRGIGYGKCSIKKAVKFKELNRLRKKILGLQVMPVTVDNFEIIYEITKGYKGTATYDMPFEI